MSAERLPSKAELVSRLPQVADTFYARVFGDPLLAPLFGRPGPHHAERMTAYMTQNFAGGDAYDRLRGGLPTLIDKHRGRPFGNDARERWLAHMRASLAEHGLAHPAILNHFEETSHMAQHESRLPRARRMTENLR